jgi:hypothetical protein
VVLIQPVHELLSADLRESLHLPVINAEGNLGGEGGDSSSNARRVFGNSDAGYRDIVGGLRG